MVYFQLLFYDTIQISKWESAKQWEPSRQKRGESHKKCKLKILRQWKRFYADYVSFVDIIDGGVQMIMNNVVSNIYL